jgi:hypothetical protein
MQLAKCTNRVEYLKSHKSMNLFELLKRTLYITYFRMEIEI